MVQRAALAALVVAAASAGCEGPAASTPANAKWVDGATLADPPSSGPPPYVRPLLVEAPERLSGADRLYSLGQATYDDGDLEGGLAHFEECAAFFPEFAPCQRELGIARALRDERLASPHPPDDAIRALEAYLRLAPDAPDRDDVRRFIEGLERGLVPLLRTRAYEDLPSVARDKLPPPASPPGKNDDDGEPRDKDVAGASHEPLCRGSDATVIVTIHGPHKCIVRLAGEAIGVPPVRFVNAPSGTCTLELICGGEAPRQEVLEIPSGSESEVDIRP